MDRTVRQMIINIIDQEMRFYKHYDGQVVDVNDPLTKGRVRVVIPYLGQASNDQGVWAYPRQLHALDVPKVGEYVEVYFINGDRTRAVYLANSSEYTSNIPKKYLEPTLHVLHQDPTTGDSVVYDDKKGNLDLELTGSFGMIANGEDLKTVLDSILSHILGLTTSGSPTTHVLSPGTVANLTADQVNVDKIFRTPS